jgi:hypothetical protein
MEDDNTMGLAIILLNCLLQSVSQPELYPDALALLRQSEVVGFVQLEIASADPASEWRQHISIHGLDMLKGTLERHSIVMADSFNDRGYPTWFDQQRAEYLVFLQRKMIGGTNTWTTLASFLLMYKPDETGKVVGFLEGSQSERFTRDDIRAHLRNLIKGTSEIDKTAQSLTSLFRDVAHTLSAPDARKPVPYSVRLLEAQRLAASVRMDTFREDIEKIFPQEDGGISGPESTRYYLGSEVMVEVPFDQTGGAWSQENKVNGPPRVYSSRMHLD